MFKRKKPTERRNLHLTLDEFRFCFSLKDVIKRFEAKLFQFQVDRQERLCELAELKKRIADLEDFTGRIFERGKEAFELYDRKLMGLGVKFEQQEPYIPFRDNPFMLPEISAECEDETWEVWVLTMKKDRVFRRFDN